jgi:hypothetical protein
MTMYDRASGFTWREIAERRARIMHWWDDHDVHVLEYPGRVIIPLWLQGKGLTHVGLYDTVVAKDFGTD